MLLDLVLDLIVLVKSCFVLVAHYQAQYRTGESYKSRSNSKSLKEEPQSGTYVICNHTVCWTAPATSGLLTVQFFLFFLCFFLITIEQ